MAAPAPTSTRSGAARLDSKAHPMRRLLLLPLVVLAACGSSGTTIVDYESDLTPEFLKQHDDNPGPWREEMSVDLILFHYGASVMKSNSDISAKKFSTGPLWGWFSSADSQYDAHGKLAHAESRTSVLWDALYSSHDGKFRNSRGEWQAHSQWSTLFGLFGGGRGHIVFLFIPISVG